MINLKPFISAQPYLYQSNIVKSVSYMETGSRSLCFMCLTEFLERFVSWDKHLVRFLGKCSKDCHISHIVTFFTD